MSKKGFTLIELMIVVAIIAVIAAIAIPNLLRARIAANESATIANMKAYASAQNIYHRTDYDADMALEYAQELRDLHDFQVLGKTIDLIDLAFSMADSDGLAAGGGPSAKAGYLFTDCGGTAIDGAFVAPGADVAPLGWLDSYAITSEPNSYNRSGLNCFCIALEGTVYMRDAQNGTFPTADNIYPDDEISAGTWLPTGTE